MSNAAATIAPAGQPETLKDLLRTVAEGARRSERALVRAEHQHTAVVLVVSVGIGAGIGALYNAWRAHQNLEAAQQQQRQAAAAAAQQQPQAVYA